MKNILGGKGLGQKSCRTKLPRMLRFFGPNFAPFFAPTELFEDVSCFVSGETENPNHFLMANPQAHSKKNPQKFSSGEQAKKGWGCFLFLPHTLATQICTEEHALFLIVCSGHCLYFATVANRRRNKCPLFVGIHLPQPNQASQENKEHG